MESLNWPDKAKKISIKVAKASGRAVRNYVTHPADPHERMITEARKAHLANPDVFVLDANNRYRKWLKGEIKPTDYNQREIETYERVKMGRENPYISQDSKIDPSISDEKLKELTKKYSKEKGEVFVGKAKEIASRLGGKDEIEQTDYMAAIESLIGTPAGYIEGNEPSLFYDSYWHTSKYKTVFQLLDVDYEDVGIDKNKIMAGVELTAGLWVRLADMDAVRPVSGANFAPPMQHCSFLSLTMDSGWLDHTGQRDAFINAQIATYGENSDSTFLEQFRDPDFFARVAGELEAA